MPNAIIKKYLKFAAAKSISGKAYEDERASYIDRSGLFVSALSQKKPGKVFGTFYVLDDNHNIAKIITSSGDLKETDEYVTIKTGHSIYSFSKDYQLTDREEKTLYEYAIGKTLEDAKPLPSERKEPPKTEEPKPIVKEESTPKLNQQSKGESEKPTDKKTQDGNNEIEMDFPVISDVTPSDSSKKEPPKQKENTKPKEAKPEVKEVPKDKTPKPPAETEEDESPSFFDDDDEEEEDDGFFDNQDEDEEEDDYDEIFGFDETDEDDW